MAKFLLDMIGLKFRWEERVIFNEIKVLNL